VLFRSIISPSVVCKGSPRRPHDEHNQPEKMLVRYHFAHCGRSEFERVDAGVVARPLKSIEYA